MTKQGQARIQHGQKSLLRTCDGNEKLCILRSPEGNILLAECLGSRSKAGAAGFFAARVGHDASEDPGIEVKAQTEPEPHQTTTWRAYK